MPTDTVTRDDLLDAYLQRFDASEIDILRKIYIALCHEQPEYQEIDKTTFLQYFGLPGLWGERLFEFFATRPKPLDDNRKPTMIDYPEFLSGIARCCRSPRDLKIRYIFQLFDLDRTGILTFDTMVSLFSNIPNVSKYILSWEEILVDARIVYPKIPPKNDTKLEDVAFAHSDQSLASHETTDPPTNIDPNYQHDLLHLKSSLPSDLHHGLLINSDEDHLYVEVPSSANLTVTMTNDNATPTLPAFVGNLTHSTSQINQMSNVSLPVKLTGSEYGLNHEGSMAGTMETIRSPRNAMVLLPKGEEGDENNDMTVRGIVRLLLRDFGVSNDSGLTFNEFKSWVENGGTGLLVLFNEAMNEEFWGLSGRTNANRPSVTVDRPISAFMRKARIKGNTALARISHRQSCLRPQTSENDLLNQPLRSNTMSRIRKIKSIRLPASKSKGETKSDHKCKDMESYTKSLTAFSSTDPASLYTIASSTIASSLFLSCPNCRRAFCSCPRCSKRHPELRISKDSYELVIYCMSCKESEPIAFNRCWHCDWEFKNSSNMSNKRGATAVHSMAHGRIEGEMTIYHNGMRKKRYFIQIGSMLYCFKKHDCQPSTLLYLGGSSVRKLATAASESNDNFVMHRLRSYDAKPQHSKVRTTIPYRVDDIQDCHGDVDPIADVPLATRAIKDTQLWGFSLVHKTGVTSTIHEFYVNNKDDRDKWMRQLCFGTGQRKVAQVYRFGSLLGMGKFSSVYRATNMITGQNVAIKVIKQSDATVLERELLKTELRIISVVSHPSVIKIFDWFIDSNYVSIVMELVEGGDLGHHLSRTIDARRQFEAEHQGTRNPDVVGLPEDEVSQVMQELFSTVAYLHQCGIAHRDLKPENILISTVGHRADGPLAVTSGRATRHRARITYSIKLTDFGLSFICGHERIMTQPCGTLPYVAPEVLGRHPYGMECDSWSCGVVMYLLVRGRLPFDASSRQPNHIKYKLNMTEHPWDEISEGAKDLISKLLTTDVDARLSPKDALQHMWIKNPCATLSTAREPKVLAICPDGYDPPAARLV